MQGKLRIGLAKQSVLQALAHAITMTEPLTGAADSPSSSTASSSTSSSTSCSSASVDIEALRSSYPSACEVVARPNGYPPVLLDARRKFSGNASASEKLGAALEEAVVTLKQVFSELPSYDALVPALLRTGVAGARASCGLTAGIPVQPMLAKPTRGVREILDRFSGITFTCEWKYDGERAQVGASKSVCCNGCYLGIGYVLVSDGWLTSLFLSFFTLSRPPCAPRCPQVHRTPDGKLSIFSRNSEDTSGKYPDLAAIVNSALGDGTSSCILDGEVIAYDREKNCLLPFQVLSTRARKDVTMDSIKVQVIYVAFDLLYLNGQSLLSTPLVERRKILRTAFKEVPGQFGFATASESSDVDEIAAFLNDAVKGGCEGLMVKVGGSSHIDACSFMATKVSMYHTFINGHRVHPLQLFSPMFPQVLEGRESVYEPSKRSLNWLKLKKDYMDGLTDTFDLVR